MTLVLTILLLALGLLLWLLAGLLPVVRLRPSDAGLALSLETTWMGALTLGRRLINNVQDARFVQNPNVRRGGEIQVRRDGTWEPLSVGLLPDAVLQAQLADIVRRLSRSEGGAGRRPPKELALPMRGRMNLMLGFAIFFPLGTVSIFAGVLLLTRLL